MDTKQFTSKLHMGQKKITMKMRVKYNENMTVEECILPNIKIYKAMKIQDSTGTRDIQEDAQRVICHRPNWRIIKRINCGIVIQ